MHSKPDKHVETGAHPRRCGEHRNPNVSIGSYQGSSPQVRGTFLQDRRKPVTGRAHPRRCGEHVEAASVLVVVPGSSPQVRGTSQQPNWKPESTGLIPAGAGNMTPSLRWARPGRAHPRRCGEHQEVVSEVTPLEGSSPQVRGTSALYAEPRLRDGLIPAGAGNIHVSPAPQPRAEAHPRRCGEHLVAVDAVHGCSGSSPQVRGTW